MRFAVNRSLANNLDCQVSQINFCHSISQVTSRSTGSKRAPRSYSFSSGKVHGIQHKSYSLPSDVCSLRCVSFQGFSPARYGRNVPRQFDLAEGCTTCPFHSFSPRPSAIPALFSLCLYFAGAAVICCDKAASTGDARVSRVEGHAPSFPARALSRAPSASRQAWSEESLWYICNHVTRYARALLLQLPLVTIGCESFFTVRTRAFR